MHSQDSSKPKPATEIDQMKLQRHLQELRDNQNLAAGVLVGALAAAAGATVWAVLSYLTHYQLGVMAIGVGLLVGYGVRRAGNGIDTVFGVAGALLSLAGCLAGNLLAACIFVADHQGVSVMAVVSRLDVSTAFELLKETFNTIDLLFYGLAVHYGYKYSFHKVDAATLEKMMRPAGR